MLVFTLFLEVSKLSLIFLNASKMVSDTFKASMANNTKYMILIIRCLVVSFPPAMFDVAFL
ncbi:hypothetical protein D3C72_1922730 [compost metagenome]